MLFFNSLVMLFFKVVEQKLRLLQACKNGLAQHLDLLLFYGADINAQTSSHDTPLHICTRFDEVFMSTSSYYYYYYILLLQLISVKCLIFLVTHAESCVRHKLVGSSDVGFEGDRRSCKSLQ